MGKLHTQFRKDGIDNKKNPAQLPISDPNSRILPDKEGGYAPNYTPMEVTETQNGFIVGEDVLFGNVEHICMMGMIDAIEADYQSHTETMMAASMRIPRRDAKSAMTNFKRSENDKPS
ncbi:hypothetical protein SH449x_000322 [Pirellulaceae bacterium SH449]